MSYGELNELFAELSTPLLVDACVWLNLPLRLAPAGIESIDPKSHIAGRARPVQFYGSLEILLEAMANSNADDILVIDNAGKTEEACIGDLTALQASACHLGGIVVWGCHRDTARLTKVHLPIFSYGSYPCGPLHSLERPVDALDVAWFGNFQVTSKDIVFADEDGVLFLAESNTAEVLTTACCFQESENRQVQAIESGKDLKEQLRFEQYLQLKAADPSYTFRHHLRVLSGTDKH